MADKNDDETKERLFISELNIYPVKSLGPVSLNTAEITDRGFKYDRRWMVTDMLGNFLSQRKLPGMALLKVEMSDSELKITHKTQNISPLSFSLKENSGKSILVNIWEDHCEALGVNTQADQWLSDVLGIYCQLVYMPDETCRKVDASYALNNELVSFADAFPFLIAGEASLEDLNKRMDIHVPMERFRPNFVFSGGEPYEEDHWKKFQAGEVIFHVVKPCARCVMITIDQSTAKSAAEPLSTLSDYRKQGNKVMFGQNLLHRATGRINLGDEIHVLDYK